MRAPARPVATVPPLARARALGALVPRGEHAIAYGGPELEAIRLGFILEGLEAGERVLAVAGKASARALAQRLRSEGAAAPASRPDALRVLVQGDLPPTLVKFLGAEARRARSEGYEGLRLVQACAPAAVWALKGAELALPRRFRIPITVLCLYDEHNLQGASPDQAWALARSHSRILCV